MVTVIRFILLASNLIMAMAFSFLDCHCDHTFKVFKRHTSVLLSLVGAPLKDWYDQGLKFWFEEIFFWLVKYARIFWGLPE